MTKHRDSHTRLHNIWLGMKTRCFNPNHDNYCFYGGRGISVCGAWKHDYLAFKEWSILNGYSDRKSLDRIDGNKDYSPENCRWVDHKTQCRNRRSNVFYKGKTLAEWCEIYSIRQSTLNARLKSGWSMEDALNKPVRASKKIINDKESKK